ncbi:MULTISPECIES: restriction endonuclease subunit S [Pseudomonas]|uniref:restriction endonuclease subunit S n=1 Tax=Pseudomonas TaxID=286 RepID=UPI00061B125E|nr:restriction endonuclease subunit S [Pseudomonas syringae]MBP1119563.1 type I restriction enzyme S subunit [Pseudomonas sp. PvP028]
MSWSTVPAAELMLKRGGSVNPANFPDETFELLSIPAFDKGEPEIVEGKAIGSSKSCVQPNDVLLSKIVPHIKRCWVVPARQGTYRQIGSGEWIIFRSDKVHPPFLKHFLTSDLFHKQFINTTAGVGGSLVRARPAEVGNIEVPLPPLPEQRRIAIILDKADAIRRKRQQAIQLADDFLRTVFIDMFGDPVTNSKGWPVKSISAGLKSIASGWSAVGSNRPRQNGEIGVLKISAVTSGKFKPEENKSVSLDSIPEGKKLLIPKKGDLLFSRANTRELVAATCIVKADVEDVFLPDKLWLVKTDQAKLLPEFLNYMVWQPRFKEKLTSQATGTSGSMLNISKQKFEETTAIFPCLEHQKKFARIYWDFQVLIESAVESSEQAEQLFRSLSQKAFSGHL